MYINERKKNDYGLRNISSWKKESIFLDASQDDKQRSKRDIYRGISKKV
jgi:hypothetical protein